MDDQEGDNHDPLERPHITPELLLRAYAAGYFPMAEHAESEDLFWMSPRQRGVLPLDGFLLSRSLEKTIRSKRFTVYADQDFEAVISACAQTRPDTWINQRIRTLYSQLFEAGYVHTLECFHDGQRVGGLYGLALGRVFFGESMFHTMRDASKVALAHLVVRLRLGGFILLDTQFVTPHLASLGGVEMAQPDYQNRLQEALQGHAVFSLWPDDQPDDPDLVLKHLKQRSIRL